MRHVIVCGIYLFWEPAAKISGVQFPERSRVALNVLWPDGGYVREGHIRTNLVSEFEREEELLAEAVAKFPFGSVIVPDTRVREGKPFGNTHKAPDQETGEVVGWCARYLIGTEHKRPVIMPLLCVRVQVGNKLRTKFARMRAPDGDHVYWNTVASWDPDVCLLRAGHFLQSVAEYGAPIQIEKMGPQGYPFEIVPPDLGPSNLGIPDPEKKFQDIHWV